MLDELKMLIDLVSKLPQLALWVLIGLFAYKVCVVGSIFGVARLLIVKLHSWMTTPKHELVKVDRVLAGSVISEGVLHELLAQFGRLQGTAGYIHSSDVARLRAAIDDKIAKEAAK